jgi:hypothetical protein
MKAADKKHAEEGIKNTMTKERSLWDNPEQDGCTKS